MRSVLSITPTTNPVLSNPQAQRDQMASFARVLMGLNHSVAFIGQAREVDSSRWPWPKPPQVTRRWFAVVTANDQVALDWQCNNLEESLNGIDLHCTTHFYLDDIPSIVEVHPTYVVDEDGDYTASLVLRQWPREVTPGWLGRALSGETPVDVGLHFDTKDPKQFARYLRKQQNWQREEVHSTGDAGSTLGHRDASNTREKLVAGIDRPCRIAVILTVHARSLAELQSRMQTTRYDCGIALADVRPIDLEHDRGREATEPTGRCTVVGAYRTLDCTSVATTGIFQPPTINHVDGVDIGTTHTVGSFHKGSQLVRLDPFDLSLEGFSGVVCGKKRMGKSYLMKIIARGQARLGTEVTIVEQRRPPEYAVLSGEPNIHLVNVEEVGSDDDDPQTTVRKRTEFLRQFTTDYWNACRADPKPRMLIVDEAWALLKSAQGSDWIEEVARTGGHFGLSFWVLSQQVREFLATGQAALDNAEIIICLKQLDNDLDDLAKAIGMPDPARVWLSGAARGQVLLRVGSLWLAVDVARVPEHFEISTDPRDVWNLRKGGADDGDDVDDATGEDGTAGRGMGSLRVHGGRASWRRAAVAPAAGV